MRIFEAKNEVTPTKDNITRMSNKLPGNVNSLVLGSLLESSATEVKNNSSTGIDPGVRKSAKNDSAATILSPPMLWSVLRGCLVMKRGIEIKERRPNIPVVVMIWSSSELEDPGIVFQNAVVLRNSGLTVL